MAVTLTAYLITCLTENLRIVSDYRTTAPTTCPHNNTHTIDPDQTKVYHSIGTKRATIVDPVEGYYQIVMETVDIPVGVIGAITTKDVSWPCDIIMWSMIGFFETSCSGDYFDVITAPDTAIGAITSNVSNGVTTITVSETVTQYLIRGVDISLYDGVNRDDLGRVTSIDTINHTVTFETATTQSFNAGTFVLMNIYTIKHFEINTRLICAQGTAFGNRLVIGKPIPADTIMSFRYTNNSILAKKLYCKLEYSIAG